MLFTSQRKSYAAALVALVLMGVAAPMPSARADDDGEGEGSTGLHITITKAPPSRTDLSPAPAALPAPVTVITPTQIERTPVASYGDVFRPVPGMDVANYGQGGIGYGLSLRGFTNAEHGRDIAYFIDGVPVNDVSSIHTRNYADLNILVPETVEHIDVIRGPFDVEYGDSNLGGAINIVTKQDEPFGAGGFSGGSYETFRSIGAYSRLDDGSGGPVPFLFFEGYDSQGYRTNSDYRRYNSFNKLTFPTADGTLSVRTQFYGGDWGAPGYINRDEVRAGTISDRAATDPTDGGNKLLEDLVLNYDSGLSAEAFNATAYVSHDSFTRWANFSSQPVTNCNPMTGCGQQAQIEDRTTLGGTVRKVWTDSIADAPPVELLIGGNCRTDLVNATQYPTANRHQIGTDVVALAYAEHGLGAFSQIQAKPIDWLKLTVGSRYDHFFYDVHNHLVPANSPAVNTGVWSPKAGFAISPARGVELYANYGQGFRSPSVVDDLLSNPSLQPMKLVSKEIGIHITALPRTSLLFDAWTTDINNESFQPAPGLPEQNIGRSRRRGLDVEARYRVWSAEDSAISLFFNLGLVSAHLIDQGPGAIYVPNVPVYVAQVGADFDLNVDAGRYVGGQIRVDFIGYENLSEDGGQRTKPYQRVTGKLNYNLSEGWTAFSQATWYPTDRLSEFAVNFGPLTGASSSDIFVSPVPAFTFLLGLTYRFKTGA